ncbi:MAG: DNA-3-methyladenine glycosylase [Saprospiraceae bacterium]
MNSIWSGEKEVIKNILPEEYYQSQDVLGIAKSLLGKLMLTRFDGQLTAGIIVETEAYMAPDDKASHAYGNRRTARTETMFSRGGVSYIYLCYGIHHLFNIVTGRQGTAHAVLIRALQPIVGIDWMMERRNLLDFKPIITKGPGSLTKALGIDRSSNELVLFDPASPIIIADHGITLDEEEIIASPRVGVGYAADWALKPWRFRIKNNLWTSPAK